MPKTTRPASPTAITPAAQSRCDEHVGELYPPRCDECDRAEP
jgi:hypothetical protein